MRRFIRINKYWRKVKVEGKGKWMRRKRKTEKVERGKVKYEYSEFSSEARVDDKYFYRHCISPFLRVPPLARCSRVMRSFREWSLEAMKGPPYHLRPSRKSSLWRISKSCFRETRVSLVPLSPCFAIARTFRETLWMMAFKQGRFFNVIVRELSTLYQSWREKRKIVLTKFNKWKKKWRE